MEEEEVPKATSPDPSKENSGDNKEQGTEKKNTQSQPSLNDDEDYDESDGDDDKNPHNFCGEGAEKRKQEAKVDEEEITPTVEEKRGGWLKWTVLLLIGFVPVAGPSLQLAHSLATNDIIGSVMSACFLAFDIYHNAKFFLPSYYFGDQCNSMKETPEEAALIPKTSALKVVKTAAGRVLRKTGVTSETLAKRAAKLAIIEGTKANIIGPALKAAVGGIVGGAVGGGWAGYVVASQLALERKRREAELKGRNDDDGSNADGKPSSSSSSYPESQEVFNCLCRDKPNTCHLRVRVWYVPADFPNCLPRQRKAEKKHEERSVFFGLARIFDPMDFKLISGEKGSGFFGKIVVAERKATGNMVRSE
eukprot:jgi/Bigna1/74522/fgenesh1_pg.29_\